MQAVEVVPVSGMSDSVLGQYLLGLAWDPKRLRHEYESVYDDALGAMNNGLREASNEWVYAHNQEAKGEGVHTDAYAGILGCLVRCASTCLERLKPVTGSKFTSCRLYLENATRARLSSPAVDGTHHAEMRGMRELLGRMRC